jgi:hypothetical protein
MNDVEGNQIRIAPDDDNNVRLLRIVTQRTGGRGVAFPRLNARLAKRVGAYLVRWADAEKGSSKR